MDEGKKCPKCVEFVQSEALVCKHCGHKFTKAGRTAGGIMLATVALVVLGLSYNVWSKSLSAAERSECAISLESAKKVGIIMDRPSEQRINVDEAAWATLPAFTKAAILTDVACDSFGKKPEDMSSSERVEVYGYKSGNRLALRTNGETEIVYRSDEYDLKSK